jgi:hypothetical protein
LTVIFPRDRRYFNKDLGVIEYTLSLRFAPPYDAESQVNLARYSNGNSDVILYEAAKNVFHQIGVVKDETGERDVNLLAKSIKVESRRVSIPQPVLQKLLDEYAAIRIAPKFDTAMHLDATIYDLWYDAASNKAHFSISGPAPGLGPYRDPIVRWMNKVLSAAR